MQACGVPEVELDADPGIGEVVEDSGGLIVVVQEIAGHVVGVQGFKG